MTVPLLTHRLPLEAGTVDQLESCLARGARQLRLVSGADLVFGGPVVTGPGSRPAIAIRALEGNLGRSLLGLHVVAGSGLGGKALALGRPVMVHDYANSAEIVHDYDQAVAPERIATVLAVPVHVGGALGGLLYVASRADVALTRRVVEQALTVARSVERDVLVERTVRRRLAASSVERALAPGGPDAGSRSAGSRTPLRPDPARTALRAELDEAVAAVADPAVRARIQALTAQLLGAGPTTRPRASGIPSITLTPREHEVVRHVASGLTNRATAEALGLRTTTVKAYLKSAARKLGATNRVHAARLARDAGLLA
ncbi:LuxR C-terminal-related transcriptional regulator [Intrasporangium sp.]|uniref:LuxR C-terminal-related transcriptional regulator n=1 Tax=Intrasporangium sp. TaxID=1925024 RepID=UPI0032219250